MILYGYVKNQQSTFDDLDINIIDVLVFSWLSYYDFSQCNDRFPIKIEDLKDDKYFQTLKAYRSSAFPRISRKIMKQMFVSNRYKDVEILDYAYIFDKKLIAQTAALALKVKDKIVIAFEGTDTTFLGWREDFILSYKKEIPSYRFALDFYQNIINRYDNQIILTGHSKGGNIAAYLLSTLDSVDRIEKVYSFDGPGFTTSIFDNNEDRLHRLVKIIPKSSLVGVLFSNESELKIVKSYDVSILQHSPLKWQIKDNDFVYTKKRSLSGKYLDKAINSWINSINEEEKEKFSNILFDSLDSLDTDDFMKMAKNPPKHLSVLMKEYKKLNKEDKKLVKYVVGKLIKSLISPNRIRHTDK